MSARDTERGRTARVSEHPRDPYLDPATGILANLLGARTQHELSRAEDDFVAAAALHLAVHPIAGAFDLDHLCAIHRHLFGDVYPFAGEVRTVNIYKANDPSSHFFPVERFTVGQEYVFGEIAADNYLQGLAIDRFVSRLAHHYDAINHLHPFREGNGRAQRVFVDQLAEHAGYQLDWTTVSAAENVAASRDGVRGLRPLFDRIVSVADPARPASPARGAARLAALDFPHRLTPTASESNPATPLPGSSSSTSRATRRSRRDDDRSR